MTLSTIRKFSKFKIKKKKHNKDDRSMLSKPDDPYKYGIRVKVNKV